MELENFGQAFWAVIFCCLVFFYVWKVFDSAVYLGGPGWSREDKNRWAHKQKHYFWLGVLSFSLLLTLSLWSSVHLCTWIGIIALVTVANASRS